VHAVEWEDMSERWVLGVLWHPESTYEDTKYGKIDEANELVFKSFFDQVWKVFNERKSK
jgi:gamma-glutamyl-gamma-aminobutyrate hydrolase PuuD